VALPTIRNALAVCGLVVFLIGCTLGGIYLRNAWKADRLNYGLIFGVPQSDCVYPLDEDIQLERRVMSVSESQIVTIRLPRTAGGCEGTIELAAPKFEVSPSGPRKVPQYEKPFDIAWVIAPTEPGTFQLVVLSGGGTQTRTMGVTVTNILGLNAKWAYILSIASFYVGPAIALPALPWWYDRCMEWWGRKKKSRKRRAGK